MDPLQSLQNLRERHGDVFTVRPVGGAPSLIVSDPGAAKQALTAPPGDLHAGECNGRTLGWLLGEGSLMVLDGKRHIDHRRLLLPPLRGERLERHAEEIRKLTAAHVATWPVGEETPTLPLLRALTLEIVLQAIFGSSEEGAGCELREALPAPLLMVNTGDTDPSALRKPIGGIKALIDAEIARRRAGARPGRRGDILSQLLDARREDGSRLANEEVRDEALTLIVAGTGPTANALAWALERLARAPQELTKAAMEARDGGGRYTDAVIQETLRTRPAVPTLARLAKRELRIGGCPVAAGTVVAPSPLLIHHRADVYPDPACFRPERFLERPPGTYTWLPFGGGSRRCVGAGFALLEMRLVLAGLLSRLRPRAVDPAPEQMRLRGNALIPARKASLVFEPVGEWEAGPVGRR